MKKWLWILICVGLALVGGIYVAEMRYKYSCQSDDHCYPCTRWMNCVSEDFYIQNSVRCRLGGEANVSRIVCGCSIRGRCETKVVKPYTGRKVDVWVPAE